VQVGRTTIDFHRWLPRSWDIKSSLMSPKLYGLGVWITHDMWAGRGE
jgi:hypothetical protein